jgi:hypothetical protein
MKSTVAVVVGISQYSDPSAPFLPTACKDALRIAAELQKMGVEGSRTFVFLEPGQAATDKSTLEPFRAALKPGTHVTDSCSYPTIDTFWRQTLRTQAQNSDSLFFYWCGHGITDARAGVPYLICSDWTSTLQTRRVDRMEVLNALHSDPYAGFRSQMLLFEACGNNIPVSGAPGMTDERWNANIEQVAIASAARGEYAAADADGAYFTRTVRSLLEEYQKKDVGWPDLDDFSNDLRTRLETEGRTSSIVRYRRGTGDEDLWYAPIAARDELRRLLNALPIGPQQYRPLYLLVVSSLAVQPSRGTAISFDEIVLDLWNAHGSAGAARAPYPVVEFAIRVCRAFRDQAAELQKWVDNPTFVQPADAARVRALLDEEENSLFLVVELIESKSNIRPGDIDRFCVRLLRWDHARAVPLTDPDSGTPDEPLEDTPQIAVDSWADLETKLLPKVVAARNIARAQDATLTIEFVTNVFDVDPHLIDLAPDTRIGDEYPVILRWRDRSQQSKERRQVWVQRAEQIRQGNVATAVLGIGTGAQALQACAMVFVRHLLPKGSRPKYPDPLTPEWQIVGAAIRAGAPFICWPLRDDTDGGLAAFEQALTRWVIESRPVDRIPTRFMQERPGRAHAAAANLFWDDPLVTFQLREIRKG